MKIDQTQEAMIKSLFEGHKQSWERYLTQDDSGLFVYLEDIASVNFFF